MQRQELHNQELPIAYLNATFANANRNPKTRKTPFSPTDFCLFTNPEEANTPSVQGADAYMAMVKDKELPAWGLFCFKDMKDKATGNRPPLVSFVCEDAILLAPVLHGDTYLGLLLAQESASGKKRKMTSPSGQSFWLQMPEIGTKFVAIDGAELQVV